MKDSFIFYTEYREGIESMSDAQAGALIKALIAYTDGDDPQIEDPAVRMVFLIIKQRMDRDREKWEKVCEKRREAGKLGGRPQKKDKAKEAKGSSEKQKKQNKAKKADSDTDSDCDAEYIPPIVPRKESQTDMFERLIVGRAVTHEMKDVLREWVQYKQERSEPYKEAGMSSLITQAVNRGAESGADAVCNAIRESMASGYKGIVWDRIGRARPKKVKPPERAYDMNDLELKLLASN